MRKEILSAKNWIGLYVAWVLMQGIYLLRFGIFDQVEALPYMGIANDIIQGKTGISPHFLYYSGYILLHVLLKLFGLAHQWMYLVHVIIASLAFYCFIKVLIAFQLGKLPLLVTSYLYATCFLLHSWHVFLFTESIFISLITIWCYCMVCYPHSYKYRIGFWLLLIFIPYFRPSGVLIPLIAILFFISANFNAFRKEILIAIAILAVSLVQVQFIINQSPYFLFGYPNAEAEIICGIKSDLKKYIVSPWQDGMSPWIYFIKNPALSIRLIPGRILKALWMTRPHFSTMNNLAIAITLLLYYSTIVTGFILSFRQVAKKSMWMMAGICIFILPLVTICADWTNRLSAPCLPFILLMAGLSINSIYLHFTATKTHEISDGKN